MEKSRRFGVSAGWLCGFEKAEELGPYAEIKRRKTTLYALLVSAGYPKVSSPVEDGTCMMVRIPNRALEHIFVTDIRNKVNESMSVGSDDIVGAHLGRDPAALKKAIAAFLKESVSCFDGTAQEFRNCLCASLDAALDAPRPL